MSNVQVGAAIGERGRENVAGLDVNGRAVDDGPGNSVSMNRAQVAETTRDQVEIDSLLVKAFCKERRVKSKRCNSANEPISFIFRLTEQSDGERV